MSAQNGHSSYKIILDGETVAQVGDDLSPASQQGYTGHVGDNTGLVYMQARYYDPVIGRFYSNDPVDALGHLSTPNGIHGFNRYAYANNNPYKFTDPTGMSSEIELEKPDLGEVVANMFGFENVAEGTQAGNAAIDATGEAIEGTTKELGSRTSVSVNGTAGIGLGAKAGATVDSKTFQGEGFELSAGLTGTAHGATARGTVNFILIKPDASANGPIASTTLMGGAGLGGGVTIQWTPSVALILHAGAVAGASVSSKVAGVKTRVFD